MLQVPQVQLVLTAQWQDLLVRLAQQGQLAQQVLMELMDRLVLQVLMALMAPQVQQVLLELLALQVALALLLLLLMFTQQLLDKLHFLVQT